MNEQTQFFLCQCHSPEHMFLWTAFDWGAGKPVDKLTRPEFELEVCLETHLAPLPFWKRVWLAIKYVFNRSCNYGHFDSIMIRHEDVLKLGNLVEEYKARYTLYETQIAEMDKSEDKPKDEWVSPARIKELQDVALKGYSDFREHVMS